MFGLKIDDDVEENAWMDGCRGGGGWIVVYVAGLNGIRMVEGLMILYVDDGSVDESADIDVLEDGRSWASLIRSVKL